MRRPFCVKHLLWVFLVLCFVSACSKTTTSQSRVQEIKPVVDPGGKPAIELAEDSHDFGKVDKEKGGEFVHNFKMRNRGSGMFEVRSIYPAWGCKVVRYDRTVPPGGEGVISLKMNPHTCRGEVKKVTYVFTNDPNKPYFLLTLFAKSEF